MYRQWGIPLFYLEPIDGNRLALGFNLYSDFKRQRAMKLAMHSRAATFSEPVQLVQEKENQNAILVFAPVLKICKILKTANKAVKICKGLYC